jgi:triosephosphate isomerase
MNKTLAEAKAYAVALRKFLESEKPNLSLLIIPPFTALKTVCEVLKESPIKVGAQNMHWEEQGPFTGEISPLMLKDCGVEIVELGHSERRAYFGETDFTVNRKVLSALKNGLKPLVCVGETALEKEFTVAQEYVGRQIKIALKNVSSGQIKNVIIAYEPVWAIGEAGIPAEPSYANDVQKLIRRTIAHLYGARIAKDIPILYGGSVDLKNAPTFTKQPEIDGLFVGRSAWNASSFIDLIQAIRRFS